MRLQRSTFASVVTTILFTASFVQAQGVIEQVVVTAQKREQNAQNVGISVTAISAEQLQQLGYKNSTDIASQTPGLKFNQFSPTVTVYNIRGVSQNDFSDHLEPPVAVYIDDAYQSVMGLAGFPIFDQERVEVLRGPQGTLFGRNATGGLLHFISRSPGNELDGYVEVSGGRFGTLGFEGAIGGPLSESIKGRVSMATNQSDGYYENLVGRDLAEADNYAGRVQLAFDPSDALRLLLSGRYAKNDDESVGGYSFTVGAPGADGLGEFVGPNEDAFGTCPGCDLLGYREPDGDPFTGSLDTPSRFNREISGGTLHADWSFGAAELVSITDYVSLEKNWREDTDSSPAPLFAFFTSQDLTQFSQELRLQGEADAFRWVTGIYYLDTDGEQTALADLAVFGLVTQATSEITTKSWSVFGQAELDLGEDFTFIAGLRYWEDEKEDRYVISDNTGGFLEFNPGTFPGLAKQEFSDVSARLELDWHPNDALLVYASFNRGGKGGSFAAPVFLPVDPQALPHDKEVLNAYELGFKSSHDWGRFNASAFYYDYEDYQAFFLQNVLQAIANRDAQAMGMELELAVRPSPGLELILGAGVLDSTVEDITLPSGRVTDRELPQAASFSGNALLRYEWPVLGGYLAAQGSITYTDDFCFSVLCAPVEHEDAYGVGDARLGYTSKADSWNVAAFVRNVTDESYRVYALDVSVLGIVNSTWAPPRTYGVSLRYNFGR